MTTSLYDIPVETIDGAPATLKPHAGKVLLMVNVASKCGLTPQYDGLEALQKKHGAEGFSVLGFPANVVRRFAPDTTPVAANLAAAIEAEIANT